MRTDLKLTAHYPILRPKLTKEIELANNIITLLIQFGPKNKQKK